MNTASLILVGVVTLGLLTTGCQTNRNIRRDPLPPESSSPSNLTLQEGDQIQIDVPANDRLGGLQTIRRDGKISLKSTGDAAITEVVAAGKTPSELEKDLLKIYGEQLVTKDIAVIVVRSSIPVFVDGFVLKPGKIVSDKPLTVLDAIMEAGGFVPNRSDPKNVIVIRRETTGTRTFMIDLEPAFRGMSVPAFYLKPGDIVSVKERTIWF